MAEHWEFALVLLSLQPLPMTAVSDNLGIALEVVGVGIPEKKKFNDILCCKYNLIAKMTTIFIIQLEKLDISSDILNI